MSGMDAILQGGLQGYLVVALLLFAIGLAAVLLRRTLLMQFMGVELMLNAANVALLAFARFRGGDSLYRHRDTTDSDRAASLKQ